MLQRDDLTNQVLQNCSISDARYAGYYSICGLALRLRDLYKWEKGLAPWTEDEPSKVLDWIGAREDLWEKLMDKDPGDLTIDGGTFDPYDTEGINAALAPYGLFYGAGYANSLKPTFFLASLEQKRKIRGFSVYILGHELARDLLSLPALTQDGSVVIRRQSGEHFLWNQIFYLKKSGQPALRFALEAYGLKDEHPRALEFMLAKIFSDEMETYVQHELGELADTVFDQTLWRDMIGTFPHSPIELLARTLKDMLADTHASGTLPYIVREKKRASLGFYVAFLDGLRKALFPEIISAFSQFSEMEEWHVIEEAIGRGRNKAEKYARMMSHFFRTGKERDDMPGTENEIETHLLKPLGIDKEKRAE